MPYTFGAMSLIDKLMSWREVILARRADEDIAKLPAWRRVIIVPLRIVIAVTLDIIQGQLTLRAMSLVYTTLLSLVPLLAISFSVLKGFGVHNRIEPFLKGMLEPLGEKGAEITRQIIDFVDNIQVGVLGFVGFLLLFYTVVSLLQKVERALNYIWHIPTERTLPQKVRDYLSAVILGPVLIIGGMGVLATLMSSGVVRRLAAIGPVGIVLEHVGRFTSIAIIVGAFAFIYAFLPNTRVRLGPAFLGGVVAGAMWIVVGWGFASFIVSSASYTLIYSVFAALVLFMIWLYLLWLIVLMGCEVSFYAQNPHYVGVRRDIARYAIALTERVALVAIYWIVRGWYDGAKGWTADSLASHTNAPMPVLVHVLGVLEKAGLIETTDEDEPGYLPAGPPERTPVKAALDAVRNEEGTGHPPIGAIVTPQPVAGLLARIDDALAERIETMTLKDLALGAEAPAPATLKTSAE